MSRTFPISLCGFLLTTAVISSGCTQGSSYQLRQSQLQAMQLYQQQEGLMARMHDAQSQLNLLAQEKAGTDQMVAGLEDKLDIAEQRIGNLMAERDEIHSRYRTLLTGLNSQSNPLPHESTNRFEELARRYPEFEFDPETGVSKFSADLLFASGSDGVRPEAETLLHEFSQLMNEQDTVPFNILVVGHTDDKPILKKGTRSKHDTNWELSAHRATSVVKQLGGFGIAEHRMGVAGYSMFQPVAANRDEQTRQQNRRVEIFILAPEAAIAQGPAGASPAANMAWYTP